MAYKAAGNLFRPVNEPEKKSIKEKYSEGKEYFLFTGAINLSGNLINLLKAFSFFKKRQKSNMLLIIAGRYGTDDEQFTKDLKTYKFKNEVIITGKLSNEQLANITAAAYAMLYPVLLEDFTMPCLEAMQSGVPVITSNAAALPGLCGDAALYVNPGDFRDIAEKMMWLFKDEKKRSELIEAGKTRAEQFQWSKTSEQLWLSASKAFKSETA